MLIDYLLIGQGLSGTLLSRQLMQDGAKVMVMDEDASTTSSKVASGVINPVTGKRMVRSWMIEQLLPCALACYKAMGEELGVGLVSPCKILDMHLSPEARSIFEDRLETESEYLHVLPKGQECNAYFTYNYEVGVVEPVLLVDLNGMLGAWKEHLIARKALFTERFNLDELVVAAGDISYKGITAKKVIFCNGAACAENPYFDRLPWSKDKGEALIVSIPNLPRKNIYRHGLTIVPWQNNLFWVGATHDWRFSDMLPSEGYRKQVTEQLDSWLKIPYEIVDHLVAQRPVNVDRRPFVGTHPVHASVGIFNGMGTKGCSVAPYFADQFANTLLHNAPIMPEVDVQRFKKILSK